MTFTSIVSFGLFLALWAVRIDARRTTVNVTVLDTDPSISYLPAISKTSGSFRRSPIEREPWKIGSYPNKPGTRNSSFHYYIHRSSDTGSEAREIRFHFKGSAVWVYGAPLDQLGGYPLAPQEICYENLICSKIDISAIYKNVEKQSTPLLWSMDNLDTSIYHHVVLRMVDDSKAEDRVVMSLSRIEYTVPQESIKPHAFTSIQSPSLAIRADHPSIRYRPSKKCLNRGWFFGCRKRHIPWKLVKSMTLVGQGGKHLRTQEFAFMQGLTTTGSRSRKRIVRASFAFKGSAVYLYGAPRSRITFPHVDQEICLDGSCESLDAYQTYLNLDMTRLESNSSWRVSASQNPSVALTPLDPEDRSVLLWFAEGLKPTKKHALVYKAVKPNPELVVEKGMNLDHIIYTPHVADNVP
ncbi:uncharacterized protein EI90DRAFT_3115426 [Cantharellus anzutake]|uniref:uncharacterized protein n=1 Tax=Cantharellus anzutake TaxID=1750568 RepID=UPI001902D5C4|nr:uncharacterized protein EI90DRAFT_3115426 [Cantharellus anzutake]KAF8342905.1 hypothetical protein EI90DRAFT_3115426 [Cantharellus anzutake]